MHLYQFVFIGTYSDVQSSRGAADGEPGGVDNCCSRKGIVTCLLPSLGRANTFVPVIYHGQSNTLVAKM